MRRKRVKRKSYKGYLIFAVLLSVFAAWAAEPFLWPRRHIIYNKIVERFFYQPFPEGRTIDSIVVEKSRRRMTVYEKGEALKTYRIALGFKPIGHKQKEGDGRTPEGTYFITHKNPHSIAFKSLMLSYPNARDKENARKAGVKPGGNIAIHGLRNGYGWKGSLHRVKDWTGGCVAVSNREMEEIYTHVKVNTQVVILK